ncbi:hypothetical protein CA606_18325 [Caulobacter vibrioides]|uniref:Uncharacterized protein n=1 Tax=Caulobacter vibrioides TaxID=155892 RepID=A0A290N0C3_CAUVI|nr:hypothetical protein [Caulobacter vibrioides]ATC34131.1 hypothetical protein CA606_18325 [Caulobacter vibrioides]
MSKKYAHDLARIDEALSPHVCKARNARAFDFRTPGKGGTYAFSLTWTPGSLSLAGDCGELTMTHYSALWTLEEGLRWAATSDIHYLLGKTRLKETFDRDATIRDIIKMANEGAVDSRKRLRDELRGWRRERPDPYGWYDPATEFDYVDWLNDRPTQNSVWTTYVRAQSRYEYKDQEERVVVADGWELWNDIRRGLGERDVACIHTSKGLEHLTELLQNEIETEHHAYEFCYGKLGWDDYHPCYAWRFHDLLQVECIRRGAKMALEQLDADPPFIPYAWRPALADDMAAFPRAFGERYSSVLARAA